MSVGSGRCASLRYFSGRLFGIAVSVYFCFLIYSGAIECMNKKGLTQRGIDESG